MAIPSIQTGWEVFKIFADREIPQRERNAPQRLSKKGFARTENRAKLMNAYCNKIVNGGAGQFLQYQWHRITWEKQYIGDSTIPNWFVCVYVVVGSSGVSEEELNWGEGQ